MKSRNRVLSFIIALVVALGFINLPSIVAGVAEAASGLDVASVNLQVKNITEEFDLTSENNTINFSTYCPTSGAEVILWNPDGSEANGTYTTISSNSTYTFVIPGLYAMQYRLLTNGFYIYSDVIYIPVANSISAITFKNDLEKVVKAGTEVTIPETNETGVTYKVFDSYGKEITVNNGKFTNDPKILGSYYIEYAKVVSYDGEDIIQYAYKVIEFSATSSITNATIIKSDSDSEGEYKLNIEASDLYKEEKYLYQYKYYNLTDVYVVNPDGSKDTDTIIYVNIYDDTDKTYYNFDLGEFVASTANETKKSVKEISSDFIIRDLDNFTSIDAEGHTIKVTYTTMAGGKNLEKSFTRTEKFNFGAITAKTTYLEESQLTNLIINNDIPNNDEDLDEEDIISATVEFGTITLIVENGYDREALLALVHEVNFAATKSLNSKAYTSSAGVDSTTGLGVVVNKGEDLESPLDDTFTLIYNTQAKSEYHFICAYSINFQGPTNNFQGSKRVEWKMYVREESGDKTKPNNIVIGSYPNVVLGETFTVPTITASDLDDSGNTTSGVNYEIIITGPTGSMYSTPQIVNQGTMLSSLNQGNYKITYKVTDYANNVREVVINFKVLKSDAFNDYEFLSVPYAELDEVDGKKVVNTSATADYAVVYTEQGLPYSPKTTFENGYIKSVELNEDESENVVVVFVARNYYGAVYSGARVSGVVNSITPNSFSTAASSSTYTTIKPNASNKISVNDSAIWFGSNNFTIEESNGAGLYTICDGNEIIFLEAGTYTITSTEVLSGNDYPSRTTVVVSENYKSFKFEMPLGAKQVAKKGDEVEIRLPLVSNYFGYDLEIYVEDSKGNHVVTSAEALPEQFVASNADIYTINYKISSDDVPTAINTVSVSTGSTTAPSITLAGTNENKVWTGDSFKYVIQGATAVDKYGEEVDVRVYCFDPSGKELVVKTDESGNVYVDVKDAGVYTIYYTSTDVDGAESISRTNFVVEFPEEEEKSGVSPWKVIGIIFGSLVAAGVIALIIIYIIKQDKKKNKFINKNKEAKKKEKASKELDLKLYTIAESKDEKHWVIKSNNRVIEKCNSKAEAIERVKAMDKNGEAIIKVYNKNGRLIDSI